MSRPARILASTGLFLLSAAVLGGLMGASGLVGCDDGSDEGRSQLSAASATRACVGGPRFDVAGEKNVGNGRAQQFIGGQCLRAADCASGCCALPCGIC